jgi:triacylglycerol lipase
MKKKVRVKKLSVWLLIFSMSFAFLLPGNAASAKQKKQEQKGNSYPIVLCHGCAGWGRNENIGTLAFGAKYYWGGKVDLQKELTKKGYKTYTAEVGPFSSNWDRACELYAQIKGGKVDYGEAHSKRFGHERYGRTYKGFLPEWGTEDEKGKISKIHLISHSQGGQTVRVLSQLLSEGSKEEKRASGDKVSPLFKGGKSWISSITTLSAPHDGTTLADVKGANKLAAIALATVGGNLGNFPCTDAIYDLKLDQFGLKREKGESLTQYIKKCLNSSMWTNGKDNCVYDLSTNGAVELNRWVKAQKDVYYFSWACKSTMEKPLSILDFQIADPDLMGDKGIYNLQFAAQAAFIGSYHRRNYSYEIPIINKDWWPNDGFVNTISENGPKYGSNDKIVDYSGKPQIGKWNFMGVMDIDHADIVGIYWDRVLDFYLDTVQMLRKLPG